MVLVAKPAATAVYPRCMLVMIFCESSSTSELESSSDLASAGVFTSGTFDPPIKHQRARFAAVAVPQRRIRTHPLHYCEGVRLPR